MVSIFKEDVPKDGAEVSGRFAAFRRKVCFVGFDLQLFYYFFECFFGGSPLCVDRDDRFLVDRGFCIP